MRQCEDEVSNNGVSNSSKAQHVTAHGADNVSKGIRDEVSKNLKPEHAMDQYRNGADDVISKGINDEVSKNPNPEHARDQYKNGADDVISKGISDPNPEHARDQGKNGDSKNGVSNATEPERVTGRGADDGISKHEPRNDITDEVSKNPKPEHAMDQCKNGDSKNGVSNGSEPKEVDHQRADDVSSCGFPKQETRDSKHEPKNEFAPNPNRVLKMEFKQENSMSAQGKADVGCNVKFKKEPVQGRVKQEIGSGLPRSTVNPGQDRQIPIEPGY